MGAVLQEGDGYMETMTNLNGRPIKGWDDEENNHKQSENWVQKKILFVAGAGENLQTIRTMFDKTITAFVTLHPDSPNVITLEPRTYCFEVPFKLHCAQMKHDQKAEDGEEWLAKRMDEMWEEIWNMVCLTATADMLEGGETSPVDAVIAVDQQASMLTARISQEARERLKIPFIGIAGATRWAQQQAQDKVWLFRANGAPMDLGATGILPQWFYIEQNQTSYGELCEDLTDIYCIILPIIFNSLSTELQNRVKQAYDLWREHNDDRRKAYYKGVELLVQALGNPEFTQRHNTELTRCFIDLALERRAKHIMIEPRLHQYLKQAVFDELQPGLRLLDPGVCLAKYFINEILKLDVA